MTSPQRAVGATLIELLVVITLMMTMMALVGGGITDSVAKSKAQAEIIFVFNLVKKASVKAFSTGNTVVLNFSGSTCELVVDQQQVFTHAFDLIVFDPRRITIARNGLPDAYQVNAKVRGLAKTIDFAPFFSKFGLTENAGG